ncbi:serine/threonine protein kinase [Spirillospora sp. NBC_00431]
MQALEPHDPRTIGRCRILARIGAGGMAMIYFGRSGSGRPVAVKLMHAEFASEPEYRERFHHEVAATRAASGRYSPGLLDADPDAARPWLATQFLPSVSLREAVGLVGPLPSDLVYPLAVGIVEALASIHGAGIVHLDLKPANVLLTADGPRLIDFGIAAELRPGAAPAGGEPAGTWGFMPPEQASGGRVSAASDVYSFGATLAYACTEMPPSGEALDGMTDDRLRTVISDCLRADPSTRPTVPELATELAFATTEEHPGLQLPTAVTTQIDRRASEAANPPLPVLPKPTTPPGPAAGQAGSSAQETTPDFSPGPAPDATRRPAPGPAPEAAAGTTVGDVPGSSAGGAPLLRRVSRRRVLVLSGGTFVLASALAVVAISVLPSGGQPEPESPAAGPSVTPAASAAAPPSTSAPASSPAGTRTLEFYVFGTSTAKSLTTTVNGRSVTVRNRRLPYRRTVQIPPEPQRTTWRIAYRFGAGTFVTKVIVDGEERSSTGGSSVRPDVTDSHKGAV